MLQIAKQQPRLSAAVKLQAKAVPVEVDGHKMLIINRQLNDKVSQFQKDTRGGVEGSYYFKKRGSICYS